MSAVANARIGFVRHYGYEPDGIAFAPGRVNLIGEHVDYNGGLVLPMPITVGTAIAWKRAVGSQIEAIALDFADETDSFAIGANDRPGPGSWQSYLRGMALSLQARGVAFGGAQLAITGTLPRGSGLSSSASLCVAAGRALAAANGGALPPARDLALAAQSAEHDWAGVHCGIMDQMAIAAGEPGAALLLDCRDLSFQPVALPADWAVMIVQSGVRRGLVDGEYNQRRSACEAAAKALGVASLREVNLTQVEAAALAPEVMSCARHVVSEIARVRAAVAAIAAADLHAFGACLAASHASLRDDFAVSVPAVDRLVEQLQQAIGSQGGARMTGAGFGGAVVAVLARREIERVAAAITQTYRTPAGDPPQIMIELTGERRVRETQ
jgi:galactokinase